MVLISRSAWRKALATGIAAMAFAALYEIAIMDDRPAALADAVGRAGAKLAFSATAYCKGATTASGVAVRAGVAAADPRLLPVGSVVQLDASAGRYNGIYTIMDTGPSVRGRELDIYMWNCHEALAFGRRLIRLNVLRHGWNPRATTFTYLQRPHS